MKDAGVAGSGLACPSIGERQSRVSSPFSSPGCNPNGQWSVAPNGFSYLEPTRNAYQLVPLGQTRAVWVTTDDKPCVLSVIDPANTFGGIEIKAGIQKALGELFDIYKLEPRSKYRFELTGMAESVRVLALSTPGVVETPLLYVHAAGVVTIHYAVSVILRDCSLSLIYSEAELLALLNEVEATYAQANIRLVRVGPIHLLELKATSLGPQIITDGPHGDLIRDHINASGHGHLKNLVYGWDFESEPKPPNAANLSSGLTVFGGNVCFIDWGNRSMVTAHELGHALRLIDRPKGDITIMQPQRSNAPFIAFDCAQIEVLRMVAKQVA